MQSYATRAALSAVSSSSPAYAWVEEVNAVYKWDSGSSETVDNWAVLSSAESGRWEIVGAELTLPILGGGSDDWPNLEDASAALAAVGRTLRLGPGEYQAKSRAILASGTHLVCTSQTRIKAAFAPGDNRDSPILGYATVLDTSTTITADTAIGDKTITMSGAVSFAVGDHIFLITTQFRVQHFQIIGWDSGTRVATLDRPITMPAGAAVSASGFPSGSQVWKVLPSKDIVVEFNGAQIYGACNRFIEIWGGWNCNIYGPVYCGDGTSTTAEERIISFDVPSYNCHAYNIIGDGGDTTVHGLSFESAENSSFQDCSIRRCEFGAFFQDGQFSTMENCECNDNTNAGFVVGAAQFSGLPGSGSDWGSDGWGIIGGTATGNGSYGVVIQHGSARGEVDGTLVAGNGAAGVFHEKGFDNRISVKARANGTAVYIGEDAVRARVDKTVAQFNTVGVLVEEGAIHTKIEDSDLSLNGSAITNHAAGTEVDGMIINADNASVQITVSTTGTLVADRLRANQTGKNINGLIRVEGNGRFDLKGGLITAAAEGVGILAKDTSKITLGQHVRLDGHGASGAGVLLADNAIADIAAGAEIPNRSILCDNSQNTVATLDSASYSRHSAA